MWLAFYSRILQSRSVESMNDDGHGWYQAVVDRLKTMADNKENLSESLPARVLPMIEELTGNQAGRRADAIGFSMCPIDIGDIVGL